MAQLADPLPRQPGAERPWSIGQRIAYALAAIAAVALVAYAPRLGAAVLGIVVAGAYTAIVGTKIIAVLVGIARGSATPPPPVADDELPMFSVLVPLYREAEVVADLVAALGRLDYPHQRLEAMLLVEADDRETEAAIGAIVLPAWLRVVRVPPGTPKTKPRACNVGLALARGELLVVFDAEDRPEPDQLRKAAAAFRVAPERIACLQARLNFYNRSTNLITRWFALEYAAWFDLYLPGLHAIGAPIPLGGTSNHFRTTALRALGGWDAHNVTEDCDLGMRLERSGLRTRILDSTTWEEAPCSWSPWLKQRSRWMKGYWQTHLVHTRDAGAWRELGSWKWLLMLVTVGGQVASLLVNPLCWLVGACWLWLRWPLFDPHHPWTLLLVVATAALVLSNLLFVVIHVLAALQRGFFSIIPLALMLPLYWLMMSVATWRGFLQFFHAPFLWEKTPHGVPVASARRSSARAAPFAPVAVTTASDRGLGRRAMQGLALSLASLLILWVAVASPGWLRAYEQIRWAAIDMERSRLVHEQTIDASWLGQDTVVVRVGLQERLSRPEDLPLFRAMLYIKSWDGEWYQLEAEARDATSAGCELRAALDGDWQPIGSARPWGPDCLRRVLAVGVKLFVADDAIEGVQVAQVCTEVRTEVRTAAPIVAARPAITAPEPVAVTASAPAPAPATVAPPAPVRPQPPVAANRFDHVKPAPRPAPVQPPAASAAATVERPTAIAPAKDADLTATVTASATRAERGEMCEIRFALSRAYENPFDPRDIDVWLAVDDGSGAPRNIPAFFTQDYEREQVGGLENLRARGKPYWAARFTPERPGTWTWSLSGRDHRGTAFATAPATIAVAESKRRGFLRVDRDPRWFSFQNGDFFYPVAINIRSPADDRDSQFPGIDRPKNAAGTAVMESYLDKMAASGITMGRVWMAPWFGGLEWRRDAPGYHGLGVYNLKNAWVIDRVIASAAERGVMIELALNSHGPFTLGYDSQWNENPYHSANGGPAKRPSEVLVNAEAKRLFRNRFRYTAARYGANPALFAWTMWIEVNMVDEDHGALTAWHREMAAYLAEMDSGKHPISTEFNNETGVPAVWRLDDIDYTQLAAYSWGKGVVGVFTKRARELAQYAKPAILEEYGGHAYGGSPQWVAHELHDGLWVGLMLPLAGSPMPWWWNLVFSHRLDRYHARLAAFIAGEDLRHAPWKHHQIALHGKAGNLSTLARSAPDRAFLWIYKRDVSDIASDQQYWQQAGQKSQEYARGVGSFDPLKPDPGPLFAPIEQGTIDLRELKLTPGAYTVEFWDTWVDRPCTTATLVVTADKAVLELPVLTRDVAVKVRLKK
ncbi:MAG: glycosyltransferase [Planctomycetes bacterium]|nr:glycosyltransferase [Planctomycetota bacterium]